MKNAIFDAFRIAERRNAGLKRSQRVVGRKDDVVTQGDLEIGEAITTILFNLKDGLVIEVRNMENKLILLMKMMKRIILQLMI